MRYGIVELTQGNLDYNHLYLIQVLDPFPAAAIGGSSEAELASELLEIHCGIGGPVVTDIAGDKKIFRKRAWVRQFFEAHGLQAGDSVVIELTGLRRYHVYPVRSGKV